MTSRFRTRTGVAVLIGVLGLLLVVVGAVRILTPNEIDSAKAERFIQDSFVEEQGAEVRSVDCPEGVDIEAGKTFDCTVEFTDRTTQRVALEMLDDEGAVRTTGP